MRLKIAAIVMATVILIMVIILCKSIDDLRLMVHELTEAAETESVIIEQEAPTETEADTKSVQLDIVPTSAKTLKANIKISKVSAAEILKTEIVTEWMTEEEIDLACRLVYGEAGNQGYTGMVLVAQCLYNACIEYNAPPSVTRWQYGWTGGYPTYTDECREAVENVFLKGERAVDDKILFFYAPLLCEGEWHETQRFVVEYREHKFFARWE